MLSNACNAYDDLEMTLPKFMMYELERPLPRDVLENGQGKGTSDLYGALRRSSDLLAMRIQYNSYPIYTQTGDHMRFRYMRHWIETGHEKIGWKVPTLLKIAMDILDNKLDHYCCFNQALSRGEMMFGNNAMLAHARTSFKDSNPNKSPRHLLRVWLQLQKADLL